MKTMTSVRVNRRKFITISAAAAGLNALPGVARNGARAGQVLEWRGTCLGAVTSLTLRHTDENAARNILHQAVAEARRLERIFSLYQDDSSLSRLNRNGVLVAPPAELADLLSACDRYCKITGGMFDPTVQALWRCYADSFTSTGKPPSDAERAAALELVGWRNVRFDRDRVVLTRAGMGLTLNGIAQGFITDCVLQKLRSYGVQNCLVDMGEIRTAGEDAAGRPWQVSIEDASGLTSAPLSLVNQAVATSGASGFQFDPDGRCNHLFNPGNGLCAPASRTISVVSRSATEADALSTAFVLMDESAIEAALQALPHTKAYYTNAGTLERIGATSDL